MMQSMDFRWIIEAVLGLSNRNILNNIWAIMGSIELAYAVIELIELEKIVRQYMCLKQQNIYKYFTLPETESKFCIL